MGSIQNIVVCLLTAASLGLWGYTGLHTHTDEIKPLLLPGGYYAMLTLFLVWLYALAEYLRSISFSPAATLRRYAGGLLFCLVATLLIEASVKPSFKTLSDETNLMVTSRSMAFERTVASQVMAVRYQGEFNPLPDTYAVDKRPFFFPFLESFLHVLRGFHTSNAFLVNGLLLFVLLSAVFIGARQFLNGPLSVSAVFLVMACPILSITGTSGGFDLISSVFLALSMVVLFAYLRSPSSERFALLWMTLMALSQTRHESLMYFFIVLGLLAAMRSIPAAYIKENRVVIALTPLWFLMSVWGPMVNFDMTENPAIKRMFTLGYFQQNSMDLVRGLLNFRFFFPYNNILIFLAVILMAYLFVEIVVRKRITLAPYQARFALILCASVLAAMGVTLAFLGGTPLHPSGVRLFLPLSIACALVPVAWWMTLSEDLRAPLSTPLLLASIGLFLLYHPIAAEGRFANLSYPFRETSFEQRTIRQRYPDKRILVIAEIPSQFTAMDYGAVDFVTANKNIPNFLTGLKWHIYQEIIVIQKMEFATRGPDPKDILDPAYRLETVSEYSTDPESFLRISRVTI